MLREVPRVHREVPTPSRASRGILVAVNTSLGAVLCARRPWLALVACLLFAPPAQAQHHSGGSFGGSHFHGSHSSGSSRSSGSHGSSSGGSFGGGGTSHRGGTTPRSPRGLGAALPDIDPGWLAALTTLLLGLYVASRPRPRRTGHVVSPIPPASSDVWARVDVTRVRIALAGDARPYLQKRLVALAQTGDTKSRRGLLALLRGTVEALLASESAWALVGADDSKPRTMPEAEATFRRHALDARASFTHEVIRAADGRRVEASSTGIVGSAERHGSGVVLVTLVVAASANLADVSPPTPERMRALLEQLHRLTVDELVALEVVWMPAEERDLVSTRSLLDAGLGLVVVPGARAGHRICRYCQGPHTAELDECPHCGARTT